MKRRFIIYLVGFVLLTAVVTAAVISACSLTVLQRVLSQVQTMELQRLELEMQQLDNLLLLIDRQLEHDGRLAMQKLQQQVGAPPTWDKWDVEQLRQLAAEINADHIYLIDSTATVKYSSLPTDIGLQLLQFGAGFAAFIQDVYGKNDVVIQRISTSTQHGELNKYFYFSPAGADYILEISYNIARYLDATVEQGYFTTLLNRHFRDAISYNPFVKHMDLWVWSERGPRSLLSGEFSETISKDTFNVVCRSNVVEQRHQHELHVYQHLTLNDTAPGMTFAIAELHFDFSIFAQLRRMIIAAAVAVVIIGVPLVGYLSYRVYDRFTLQRVDAIYRAIDRMANGYFGVEIVDRHNDELATICRRIAELGKALQSRDQILHDNRIDLQTQAEQLRRLNAELHAEISQRQQTETKLQQSRQMLEQRVQERTAELSDSNQRLRCEVERRRQAQESLARTNQDLEQFANIASHDLHEPLRTVSSYLQLLDRRYRDQLDDQARGYIKYTIDAARRMAYLIDDLLHFSRAGRGQMTWTKVPLSTLVAELTADMSAAINESMAVIDAENLPEIEAPVAQLRQVLANLLSNALRHHDGQQTPHIKIRSYQLPNGGYRLEIADNGPGIAPRHRLRVFAIFQRLQGQGGGTGIGLSICKRLVEAWDGQIWIDDNASGGCVFVFTIPSPPVPARI